jgi:chemotaxis protein CheZ
MTAESMEMPDPSPDGQVFYQRVGEITRRLHEALRELGYDKSIAASLGTLPDARSRLDFIARLTGEAAEKVLNTVDAAQARQSELVQEADRMDALLAAGVPDLEALRAFTRSVRASGETTGAQLTDIMLAQDFHDLTGQTVRKVMDVAATLEESLLKLLLEAPPSTLQERGLLDGPVADATGRTDVVTDQAQVDDLLESLGF